MRKSHMTTFRTWFFPSTVGSKDQTQVIRLGGNQVSRLTGPEIFF